MNKNDKIFFCKTFILFVTGSLMLVHILIKALFCAFSFILESKWHVPGNKQSRRNTFHITPRISVLFGDFIGVSLHEKRCLSLKIQIRKTRKECVWKTTKEHVCKRDIYSSVTNQKTLQNILSSKETFKIMCPLILLSVSVPFLGESQCEACGRIVIPLKYRFP